MIEETATDQTKEITGYVALLDVLGFRELVLKDSHSQYLRTVSGVVKETGTTGRLQYFLFSDTILINTIDDKDDDAFDLLKACSALFDALLKEKFAVRGAIAHGKFNRSPSQQKGTIIAGKPILEAMDYEKRQDWVGIMACPSFVRKFPDLRDQCKIPDRDVTKPYMPFLDPLRWQFFISFRGGSNSRIPFHTDDPLSGEDSQWGFAIVPLRFPSGSKPRSVEEILDSLVASYSCLHEIMLYAPNPAAQRKYTNTKTFIMQTYHEWVGKGKPIGHYQQLPQFT